MKKRQKFILQRQANKVDKGKEKEAKKALKRIKVKNKKVYMTKIGRKDSDDSLAQKKHYKTIDKLKREEVIDKINADLPPYSRTFTDNKLANIRPIFGINDVSTRIKANDKAGKDAITEEFSNSQMSMVNQNNIFYAFKAKTQGKGTKDAVKKDRNVIFDNKTKRKVKMEGMYGISKAKKDGEENIGSYSDLLEGIPLSDNDDEVSNGTENLDPGSEVMFPYDTSLSSSSKTGDKSNSKNNKDNLQNQNEKDQLCISEESMDLKDGNTKQSNDQKVTKIGDSSNQNNDLKVTDKTLINNADNSLNADKDKKMKFGFEGKTSIKQKNTKFSAKIEDGSDSPFTNANALTELGGTITDFNIKAVLNMNLNKKKNKNDNALINSEEKKKTDTQNDINSEEANENNHSHEKHKKNENEETFEDLDNIEADQIQIVKKGMKIFVKRNKKLDPVKDTVPADILQPIPTLENELHVSDILHQSKSANAHHDKNKKNVKKKTNLAPYNIMREMVVNDQLLEGIVEKEEEEKKEDDEDKPKESEKKKDDENKDQGNKHEEDDDKNPYLDKFRYAYLSDIITTGTVSIVVKTNNIENMMSIPNP